jgi:NAD(P)H-dependent FMN reductase
MTTASSNSADPIRVAIIIGSTRVGRLGPRVAGWFGELAEERDDLVVDIIDLLDEGLPPRLSAEERDAIAAYLDKLEAADAFVVVTPEYNHGYPAPLKQAIDLARSQWHAKPVGFVSYGGLSGGLRAVEQLRQVFAEVHATTVRDVVSLHSPWGLFDGDDDQLDAIGASLAAKVLLDRLTWWAEALRSARRAQPYAA